LAELKKAGIITENEFQEKKKKILSKIWSTKIPFKWFRF
jgi:hypothetical protein